MNDGITFSLNKFYGIFPTEDAAREYIERKRWNGQPVCPHCGCSHGQYALTRRDKTTFQRVNGYYKCQNCKKRYTVRIGTVMERSHIPFRSWLLAIYFFMTNRHGVSSVQLSKHIGVTQKSAWFMLQRLREACKVKESTALLEGIVEVDEMFIGGKEMNKHESKKQKLGRGTIGKTPVVGMKQRKGKVHAFVVPVADKENVHRLLNRMVAKGATLHTDEAVIYTGLESYTREFVSHKEKEFSRDGVTTNAIESVWACVRRAIIGTWHGVEVQHLQRYIDEVCFRLNAGNVKEHLLDRMDAMLADIAATPHMSYKSLIGKDEEEAA